MKVAATLILLCLVACQTAPHRPSTPPALVSDGGPITISGRAFDADGETFLAQAGYLQFALPYADVKPVLDEVTRRTNEKLASRGEAHVTVVTPPEFNTLKKFLPMKEINSLAVRAKIQSARVQPVCIGRGEAMIQGRAERTYYIVLRSTDLVELRRQIQDLFIKRGGSPSEFEADHFYPHVTLGFTKADLHEDQGVVKDDRTCLFNLRTL